MPEPPVAAPDHEARVKLLRTAIEGYLGADRALDALLAERQQDKERIERLEEVLADLLGWQPQTPRGLLGVHPQHRGAIEDARAALAGEEELVDAR